MQYRGIPASHGVAIGPAFLLRADEFEHPPRRLHSLEETEGEIARYREARASVQRDLEGIALSFGDVAESRKIIEILLLLLQDVTIIGDIEEKIVEERVNAEYAVSSTVLDIIKKFQKMSDPYIRERAADIKDVGRRVLEKLTGVSDRGLASLDEPVVLVARDLDPSQTATLRPDQVLAFVTDMGGLTSHTTILAKSLGIPAVVGLQRITSKINHGDTVIVDGIHGYVIVDPTDEELSYYRELGRKFQAVESLVMKNADTGPAVTADGIRVELAANIELPHEIELVKKMKADGIGLYRTEFLRLMQKESESEDEHLAVYRKLSDEILPNTVIIRTYDMGGDKFRTGLQIDAEANPFLGYRAIRIGLDRIEEFSVQLRAILRASAPNRNVKLMFPMVTHVEQLQRLKLVIDKIKAELSENRIPYDEDIQMGIMVETPATTIALDLMLPYVDFVSIGTNDLTQYTLAVDRGNPKVANLYDSFHPAVLRQIDSVVKVCHSAGKWVGICGSMAGYPLAIPLLLGFGVDELSVAPSLIPDVKKMIAVVTISEARELAAKALSIETGLGVRSLVHACVTGKYPEILLD